MCASDFFLLLRLVRKIGQPRRRRRRMGTRSRRRSRIFASCILIVVTATDMGTRNDTCAHISQTFAVAVYGHESARYWKMETRTRTADFAIGACAVLENKLSDLQFACIIIDFGVPKQNKICSQQP